MMYTTSGKQVLRDGKHYADAINAGAAHCIAVALNQFDNALWAQIDAELFDTQPDLPAIPPAGTHRIRQESDEMVCSCGKRWDVGEDHP
jgi:hypothetical protein